MSNKTLSIFRPGVGLTAFNNFFNPWDDFFNNEQWETAMTLPKVNISESESGFSLDLAAPGLHKSDFQIEVKGNVLTISGKKEGNKEEQDEKYTRKEYNYSSFSRSFTLPEDVQTEKIEATYDGGILKLSLPKNEAAHSGKQQTISIK